MFNKTKKKIAAAILGITILFLMVTLAAIYATSYLSLRKQSEEMLERYVISYSPEEELSDEPPGNLPGELPDNLSMSLPDGMPGGGPPEEEPEIEDGTLYLQSSFYSVAFTENREIISVDTGWGSSRTYEEVTALAGIILDNGKSKGRFAHMLYRVEERDGYTLVAFMDALLMEESMREVLLYTLIVGSIAVVLFFVASAVLAGRIIKPLEDNDRKQKQFVSDAGHELKTPVAVIGANAEILSREIGENSWLSNIQYENERMGNLVRELLMLSHAEGESDLSERIDMSKLTEQEILPFESVAFERGLTLTGRIEEDVFVKGNRNQIGQLVSILTDNAISYSSGGKEVTVSLRKMSQSAVLTVENAGDLPESVRDRLFDRFYRGDESRAGAEGHFGLGLSIARSITEAHHGEIKADCGNGKVIFTVNLPAE